MRWKTINAAYLLTKTNDNFVSYIGRKYESWLVHFWQNGFCFLHQQYFQAFILVTVDLVFFKGVINLVEICTPRSAFPHVFIHSRFINLLSDSSTNKFFYNHKGPCAHVCLCNNSLRRTNTVNYWARLRRDLLGLSVMESDFWFCNI